MMHSLVRIFIGCQPALKRKYGFCMLLLTWLVVITFIVYLCSTEKNHQYYAVSLPESESSYGLKHNRKYMTVTQSGRLGNHLFQFASLFSLAKKNHFIPIIADSTFLMQYFDTSKWLPLEISTKSLQAWAVYIEHFSGRYDTNLTSIKYNQNVTILGYLQSWKYFSDFKDSIRKHLKFNQMIQSTAMGFLRKVRNNAPNSDVFQRNQPITYIGIHVRRTDMTKRSNQGYLAANSAYIARAVQHFETKYKNVIFIVCSDDLSWSKSNIHSRHSAVVFSESHSVGEDLAILSSCNHTILTVGTFGWWAGWLAGGDVIYCKDYAIPGSPLDMNIAKSDHFPPEWLPL